MPEQNILRRAAQRTSSDPLFLGHVLREYREVNDLTESKVARYLECPPHALTKLALCLCPDSGTGSFRGNVEQIALHCGANSQRLVELLREVEAVRTMRVGPKLHMPPAEARPGLLVAARDRGRGRRQRRLRHKRKRT